MTLAAETRSAVRDHPFLLEALRAGVVNYAAAARMLEVGDDPDAVATALRRFADRLPPREVTAERPSVTMRAGLARADSSGEGLLAVGDHGYVPGDGHHTGLVASGAVDVDALAHVLGVLRSHSIDVEAAAVADGTLVIIVDRAHGPDALRLIETALEAVPVPP